MIKSIRNVPLGAASIFTIIFLCASTLQTNMVFAANRWVELINDTGYDLINFYASNVDDTGWGRDRLGRHVIWNGQSLHRNIDDGSGYCIYDFKAVFEDGEELVDYGVNVCEIPEFYYY